MGQPRAIDSSLGSQSRLREVPRGWQAKVSNGGLLLVEDHSYTHRLHFGRFEYRDKLTTVSSSSQALVQFGPGPKQKREPLPIIAPCAMCILRIYNHCHEMYWFFILAPLHSFGVDTEADRDSRPPVYFAVRKCETRT